MGSLPRPHFVLFPFMAQGHTIALLHLARHLRCRCSNAAVTVVTTPANSAAIRAALHDAPDVSVLVLPFPDNIPGVPAGVENTHKLPSMASFAPFVKSTRFMQKNFEHALENLNPPVSAVVSDAFLGWTIESAVKFNVPRFVFFGMGQFSCTMYQILTRENPHARTASLDEPFPVPGFDGLTLTRNHFDPPFNEIEPAGEFVDFMEEQIVSMRRSYAVIVNSFYEMEKPYFDYWNRNIGPKTFCIGPLCLASPPQAAVATGGLGRSDEIIKFLDEKLEAGVPVLYVAFGTQAEVSNEQVAAIAAGLERSGVSFLWVLKVKRSEILQNFMETTKDRGLVVDDWVDQTRILNHSSVKGFLSHCGWNSVMESIAAGVPIIALPFMAEQHLNARLVAELVGIGVLTMPAGGTVRGLVAMEEVERAVREVMDGGERGAAARRNMQECAAAARGAMEEGGSSRRALETLIEEVTNYNLS